MNSLLQALTANPKIPLNLRRKIGALFVKMDGTAFEIELCGTPYRGKLDNYIEWMVYLTGDYFEYTYLNLIRESFSDGAALDIGANVGNHTHAFASIFDEVHSFEPFGLVADRLDAKAALFDNVTTHRVALSDTKDVLKFEVPETNNWGTGKISEAGNIEVPVEIGDHYIVGKLTQPLQFIKIDVEGHELQVLRGLVNTVKAQRPTVMFEIPREWKRNHWAGLSEAMNLFPENYNFIGYRGQTTFPIQAQLPKGVALDRNQPKYHGKLSYVLGFAEERNFRFSQK